MQSSAIDAVDFTLVANNRAIERILAVIAESKPDLMTLLITDVSETQALQVKRGIREFRHNYPEWADTAVVAVNTPDLSGCLETGYASALIEIIDQLVPEASEAGTKPGVRLRQVNVLASPMFTSGDLAHLRDIIESFELRPVFVPDLSASLGGPPVDAEHSPMSVSGTAIHELKTLGNATATLVIGPSLRKVADLLETRTGVPTYRLDHLYGLAATDALALALHRIAGTKVPDRLEQQRAQLQLAMAVTPPLRAGLSADPDQLNGLCHWIREVGCEIVAAVTPTDGPALGNLTSEHVRVGDLADLEHLARQNEAEVLIGSARAVPNAERLGIPMLRCGVSLSDPGSSHQKTFIGYVGAYHLLFDLADLPVARQHQHETAMYCATYSQQSASDLTEHPTRAHS